MNLVRPTNRMNKGWYRVYSCPYYANIVSKILSLYTLDTHKFTSEPLNH